MPIGILLWICVLKSGVHATLAGAALALGLPPVYPTDVPRERRYLRLSRSALAA